MNRSSQAKLYVITAPSGTGKTTLNRRLVSEVSDLEFSISHTTRQQRMGEINGDHYWFVTKSEFEALVSAGNMLEWANVFGNLYGTSKSEIDRILSKDHSALLEIDVQGWQQAKVLIPDAVSVFIMPPSIADLWQRLERRGTDSLETRWKRIKTARQELDFADQYRYFIVNDDLEQAYKELKELVTTGKAPRLDFQQGVTFSKKLKQEFDEAPWLKKIEQAIK